ncbi:MAG: hypothetical protein ABIG95_04755 [Candidatus Woesearchaeota archaeon]
MQRDNTAYFFIALVVAIASLLLFSPRTITRTLSGKATGTLVFDTGVAEMLTGTDHYSEIIFKPAAAMTVATIKPEIAACTGTCHYEVKIYNMQGTLLANDTSSSTNPEQIFGDFTSITLTANTQYNITQHIWSTGSVSVYATGVDE